jgi:hypothetical protein
MIPIRDDQPSFTKPFVNYFIIGLNLLRIRRGHHAHSSQPRINSADGGGKRRDLGGDGSVLAAVSTGQGADLGLLYFFLVVAGVAVFGLLVRAATSERSANHWSNWPGRRSCGVGACGWVFGGTDSGENLSAAIAGAEVCQLVRKQLLVIRREQAFTECDADLSPIDAIGLGQGTDKNLSDSRQNPFRVN